jgi:hypothetical protein
VEAAHAQHEYQPPEIGFHTYDSRDEALRAACDKMKVAHVAVLYIEGPNGERIEQDAIKRWCDAQPKTQ